MTKPTFIKKLKELFIRFNTSPKLYQKSDFYLLLQLIGGLFENSDESLLGEDGKIEEKYLPTIPTENKEYFPDFAFWQKPGAKKGAQVLMAPSKTDKFGYTKNYLDFLLEIGKATDLEITEIIETEMVDKEEYDEETDDMISYSIEEETNRISTLTGNANFKTLIKRAKDLLSQKILQEDDTFLIKFGILNAVHDRSGYADPVLESSSDESGEIESIDPEPDPFSITCTINGIEYSGLRQTTQKRQIDTPVRFSELDFYVPVSDIMHWGDEELIQIVVTGKANELKVKIDPLTALRIYTDIDSYYLPMQKSFYVLQYFQKADEWKLAKIEEKTVKVKYHKTEATLSNVILRNTYREYKEPSVIMSLGADKKVIIDNQKIPKNRLLNPGVGNMFKRFVSRSSVKHKRGASYRYKSYQFSNTLGRDKTGIRGKVMVKDRIHGEYYIIVGFPNKDYKTRTAKPCNQYLFTERNLQIAHIRYNHKLNRNNYKNIRYSYFAKVPLFRCYSNDKIIFMGYYSPKIVY